VKLEADLAVVGSGFGGSLVSLVGRRLGLSVALVERGTHPRFAIGESSSPLANLLLEEIARRYDLPRLLPLCKYGPWRRAYPDVGCGRKRGFTFYRHEKELPFGGDPERTDQLLVGASPNDEVADTHWYRPDFDQLLVREARDAGAEYLDRTALDRVEASADGVRLSGTRGRERVEIRAACSSTLRAPAASSRDPSASRRPASKRCPTPRVSTPTSQDVRRMADTGALAGSPGPPYPPDDAALHHVFDGGWIWVLRFDNGITSAGVAARTSLARALAFEEGEPAWRRLLDRLPTVRAQFEGATTQIPFIHRPRLTFRSSRASGPGWTMLPSAAAFVDPLLSTGFPLTLLGIERLGRAIERDWGSPRLERSLEADARLALVEADAAALLVAALYASFGDFPLFAALSKLYFAAASFSEAARRLGRSELATAFLCAERRPFGTELRRRCREALRLASSENARAGRRDALIERVHRTIEPARRRRARPGRIAETGTRSGARTSSSPPGSSVPPPRKRAASSSAAGWRQIAANRRPRPPRPGFSQFSPGTDSRSRPRECRTCAGSAPGPFRRPRRRRPNPC
jgi:FADH2 O2-dependent halogenase